jgi:hypothetical protein
MHTQSHRLLLFEFPGPFNYFGIMGICLKVPTQRGSAHRSAENRPRESSVHFVSGFYTKVTAKLVDLRMCVV